MTNITAGQGRSILLVTDPWAEGGNYLNERSVQPLCDFASVVRFAAGESIYRQGDAAKAVFCVIGGLAKSVRTALGGPNETVSFLFPGDLFGLSDGGAHCDTAVAVTALAAHRLPVQELRRALLQDAELGHLIIAKLMQQLRSTQTQTVMVAQRYAVVKLAMFLDMLRQRNAWQGGNPADLWIPMTRTDIGNYLGLTLAAVSRAFKTLSDHGIIGERNRDHFTITDDTALISIIESSGDEHAIPTALRQRLRTPATRSATARTRPRSSRPDEA